MEKEKIENLEETNPVSNEEEQLDESLPQDNFYDEGLDYNDDVPNEKFGKKEFEKTLNNKDYYKEEKEQLAQDRQAAEEEAERDWKYKDSNDTDNNRSGNSPEQSKDGNNEQKENKDSNSQNANIEKETGSTSSSNGTPLNQSSGPSGNRFVNEEEKDKKDDKKKEEDSSNKDKEESENKDNNTPESSHDQNKQPANKEQGNNDSKSENNNGQSDGQKTEKNKEDKKNDQKKLSQIKQAQLQNKINNAKSKTYQVLHPVEAAKAKAKAAVKRKIKKFLLSHPYIIAVAAYVVGFAFLFIIIMCMMMAVFGVEDDTEDTYSKGLCATSSAGSLLDFIYAFEGTTNTCTTTDNQPGYLATILGGETVVTAGHGFTNYAVGSALSKSIIDTNNWSKYFQYNGATYYMMEGSCVPQKVIDELSLTSVEEGYAASVENAATSLGVTLTQYQLDALTDYAYNTGSAYTVIEAYKNDGLEGMWNVMKETVHTQDGNVAKGLLSRRKAEMALFVTGDYTDQGKFYGRNYNYGTDEYNDYNSEKIVERQAECAALLTDVDGLVDVNGYKARLKRPQRTNAYYYVQDKDNYGRPSLEGECAWYARYRAEEILALAGSDKQILHSRNGGEFCDIPEANDGTFKKVTDYKKAKPGSLISWANDSYGHVAVVEMVDDEGITVSEGGIGTGYYIKEIGYDSWYMWDVFFPNSGNEEKARKDNCELNNSGCFSTRKIPWNQVEVNWGSVFQCYIYLLDD